MPRPYRRSPLALAVLGLLFEAPMHPYRMQRLIKERGKDEVIDVRQRAGLYQAIRRLRGAGLIGVVGTSREENRPERTVYELTEEGRGMLRTWMRAILSTPGREFPEFPAAVSFLMLLTPEDAARQLEARAAALEAERARVVAQLDAAGGTVPRLFLLESEYLRDMVAAELRWVRALIDDLRDGRITWTEEWLRAVAKALGGDDAPT